MENPGFDLIYERILRVTKSYQDVDLAKFLKITSQAVGAAKKKKRIPRTWFALVQEKTGVTREKLCSPETPEEKLLRTYKGNCTKDVKIPFANAQEGNGQEPSSQDFSLAEMISDAKDVLESNTVYRQALAANIRAFKQAVVNEEKMKNTDEKIDQMMQQIEALTNIVLQGQEREAEKKQAGNDH